MPQELNSSSVTSARQYTWLAVCLSVLVLTAYFVRPFYGSPGHLDESYQALCVQHWRESPLAMFLFWKAHLWTALFGDSYLSLRMLSAVITVLSIAVSCWYLGYRTHSWKNAAWMFVLCGSLGLIEAHLMYNWDTGPTLLYSLGAILMVEYVRTRRLWILGALGAVVCLVGLSRVQLFILFPVSFVYIVWMARRQRASSRNTLHRMVIFVTVFLATFTVFTTMMNGSPVEYVKAFVPQNIITGHSPGDIGRYLTVSLYFLGRYAAQQFLSLLVICVALWNTGSVCNEKTRIYVCSIFLAILGGVLMSVYMDSEFGMECGFGSTGLGIMVTALLLPVIGNIMRGKRSKIETCKIIMIVGLWIWFMAPGVGSDNFMSHFNAYGILPVTISVVVGQLPENQKTFLRYMLLFATTGFGITAAVRTTSVILSMDEPLGGLPKMSMIYSNAESKNEIVEVYDVVTALNVINCADRVNFDGNRYLFNYTMQTAPVYDLQNFHPLDKKYEIARRRNAAGMYDAWLFHTVTKGYMSGIDSMLVDEGFVCVENRIDNDTNPVAEERRGLVLFLREPYASRYRKHIGNRP